MDEQIARALCKACGRNPDAMLNGVPEWVARQVEARAAHSVMAGKVAELTKALETARRTLVVIYKSDPATSHAVQVIDAALAPHPKPNE